jgi:hypothetical protein
MKMTKLLFLITQIIGILALAAVSAYAQDTESAKPQRIFGYVDSKTGNFHALNRTLPSEEARAAITPTTGKFVVNVTIQVSSALPTNAVIACVVSAGVDDTTSGAFANVVIASATRSGNTATCTLNMPYSWDLANASKDMVSLELEVGADVGKAGSNSLSGESFKSPLMTLKVPATGTTTTQNVTTTI